MQPNKYHILDNGVVLVGLSKGQVTMIDAVDLEKVLQQKWYASPHVMKGYYASAHPQGTTIYMHRFILDAPTGVYVDHVNHDTLDNRRSNLKLCTNQENNMNRNGAYSGSKTGIRGVSVHKLPYKPYKNMRKRHNPSGLMYVFRCHCVTCKVAKYFPYSDEGLADAKAFAEAHYAAMK